MPQRTLPRFPEPETEPFWRAKFDYLHANPVRKGLVQLPEHWRFFVGEVLAGWG